MGLAIYLIGAVLVFVLWVLYHSHCIHIREEDTERELKVISEVIPEVTE